MSVFPPATDAPTGDGHDVDIKSYTCMRRGSSLQSGKVTLLESLPSSRAWSEAARDREVWHAIEVAVVDEARGNGDGAVVEDKEGPWRMPAGIDLCVLWIGCSL